MRYNSTGAELYYKVSSPVIEYRLIQRILTFIKYTQGCNCNNHFSYRNYKFPLS